MNESYLKLVIKLIKNQNRDRANTKVLTTQLFIGRRNNGRVGKRFSAAARSLPILRFVCVGLFGFWACAWLGGAQRRRLVSRQAHARVPNCKNSYYLTV
jgi:hypothetical protein